MFQWGGFIFKWRGQGCPMRAGIGFDGEFSKKIVGWGWGAHTPHTHTHTHTMGNPVNIIYTYKLTNKNNTNLMKVKIKVKIYQSKFWIWLLIQFPFTYKQCILNIIWLEDSGFKIQIEKYENAFQGKKSKKF